MSGLLEEKNLMTVNMGPQHPSTHGVLRVILDLEGETVVRARPIVGYLHTGIEKLAEHKLYNQIIPLTDRMDYMSSHAYNMGWAMAVEKMIGVEPTHRAKYIRVLVAELQRIANHLLWLGTHALDIGAMTVLFIAFKDREKITEFFERICGARLTFNYMRVGGVALDIGPDILADIYEFCGEMEKAIDNLENLLSANRIWIHRTRGVGVVSKQMAMDYSLSGPMARASGINYDLRKDEPYAAYPELDFKVITDDKGDSYSRYAVRMGEMRESVKLIRQAIDKMPKGDFMVDDPRVRMPGHKDRMQNIENLTHLFVLAVKGYPVKAGEIYVATEAPKGELGYYIVSDGTGKPWRVKMRTPSFVNLQALPEMGKGHLIADMVTLIGTVDITLGDVDR
jgi:NADH dehydrogenase I D subunit